MMRLPSLSGLRLGTDAEAAVEAEPPAPKPELSADLIASVLAAVKDGDPEEACRAAARWCVLNKAHRNACDDAAWRALIERVFPAETIAELDDPHYPDNWLGEWPDEYRHINSWGLRPDAFDTPRAFFYALCDRAQRSRMTPIWERLAEDFEELPFDYPDYFEIAKLTASRLNYSGRVLAHGLSRIPTDMPRYGEIARWAVQHPNEYTYHEEGDAYTDYIYALEWVPTDRADYGELARLAIESEEPHRPGSECELRFVPTDRADYGTLAKLAVQKRSIALLFVPTDRADYGELARIAINESWLMFQYIPTDHADYSELARLAINVSWSMFRYVPTDHADYGELARLAIEQSRDALSLVPRDHPDYTALRAAHEARWGALPPLSPDPPSDSWSSWS